MNLKVIEQRLTTLESRQPQPCTKSEPAWYQDMPGDLKADVERMERMVEEAGGLSDDPHVLKIANNLARFITTRHDRRGAVT